MMPQISRAAVSVREGEASRLSFWSILLIGSSLMGGVAVVALLLEPIVDAAWFGLEADTDAFKQEAVTWMSLLLVATAFYGLVALTVIVSAAARRSTVMAWAKDFLGFLVLLDWIVTLHLVIVIPVGRVQQNFVQVPEILMVSSVVAILWAFCFDLRPVTRPTGSIFVIGLFVFGLALVILEPHALMAGLAWLGLVDPPTSLLLSSSFLWALAYLAPVPPLLWTAWGAWRQRHQAQSEVLESKCVNESTA